MKLNILSVEPVDAVKVSNPGIPIKVLQVFDQGRAQISAN